MNTVLHMFGLCWNTTGVFYFM